MNLESRFKAHLPGLRMRALVISGNADVADRLVRSVQLHSTHNASEFLANPNPRRWLLATLDRTLEPWRAQAWSMRVLYDCWNTFEYSR